MANNNVATMCSLIKHIVSSNPKECYILLPKEREILQKGLDDLFEVLNEYEKRCDELSKNCENEISDEEEECYGCETGADCIGAHSKSCNFRRGFESYNF
ncbi:MAG: hypothetical protein CML42_09460 [Rhodobacteraceae bacterium]|nr:hypothetical protein [Paracoccaceae bacterium]|tara:strand:+ start:360 stop:659 length:300 start_codon:yes stop_codon:yes gene_type:complete